AGQAYTAHDVDFEVAAPQRIVNIKEFLGAVDTQPVDQNVSLRLGGDQCAGTFVGSWVTDHATGIITTRIAIHPGYGVIHPALVTTDHCYLGPGFCEADGNRQPDTTCGTGNNGSFV